jgi:hypothetical protein
MSQYKILHHLLCIKFYLSVIFGTIFLSLSNPPAFVFHFLAPLRTLNPTKNQTKTDIKTGLADGERERMTVEITNG